MRSFGKKLPAALASRAPLCAVLAGLCISAHIGTAQAQQGTPPSTRVPLQFREVNYPVQNFYLSAEPQSSPFQKEPNLGTNLFFRGKLNSIPIIWTSSKLYVDLNANGDFTDDPSSVYTNSRPSARWTSNYCGSAEFNKVRLSLAHEKGHLPWVGELNFNGGDRNRSMRVYGYTYSYWSGKAALNGKEMEFGWIPSIKSEREQAQKDFMAVLNYPARKFTTWDTALQAFEFPKTLFVNGTLYTVTLVSEGQAGNLQAGIKLTEEMFAPGDLKVTGNNVQRLMLMNDSCVVVLDSPEGTVRVPQGRYDRAAVQVGSRSSGAYVTRAYDPNLTVGTGAPSQLVAGGPLTNTVSISRSEDFLLLEYGLVGAGGASYSLADGDRSKPPRFVVYKDGKQVGAGNFEYG